MAKRKNQNPKHSAEDKASGEVRQREGTDKWGECHCFYLHIIRHWRPMGASCMLLCALSVLFFLSIDGNAAFAVLHDSVGGYYWGEGVSARSYTQGCPAGCANGAKRLYITFFYGGIGSGYVIAVIRRAVMSRRIEGWERWLAPDYCFYFIFLVYSP